MKQNLKMVWNHNAGNMKFDETQRFWRRIQIEGINIGNKKIVVGNLHGFVIGMSNNQQDISLPKCSAWKNEGNKKKNWSERKKEEALPLLFVKCLAKGMRGRRRTLQRETIHRNRTREAIMRMKAIDQQDSSPQPSESRMQTKAIVSSTHSLRSNLLK